MAMAFSICLRAFTQASQEFMLPVQSSLTSPLCRTQCQLLHYYHSLLCQPKCVVLHIVTVEGNYVGPLCVERFSSAWNLSKKIKKNTTKTIFPKAKPYFITNFGFIFKPAAITYTSRKKWSPPKWFAEFSQHNNNNTKIGPVWQPAPDTILIMLLYCTGKLWAVWFTMDTLGCNFTSLHFLLLRMFLTACVCRPEEAPGSASVIEISATTTRCSFPQDLMIDDLVDQ